MSQATQRQSGLRTVEHAGETVAESARRLAPAAGKAAVGVIRHPDTVVRGARRLQSAAPVIREAIRPILTGRVDDWRSEWAYSIGLQAFAYGFPYIRNAGLRHQWVTDDRDPEVVPYAAVNHFWHARRLLDATFRDGGCPNNDTLYSLAWLDLRREPVLLSHPDMGRRYFSFELTSFASDNFAYVGQRTTGPGAGHFALSGPGWKGDLPEGVRAVTPRPPRGPWSSGAPW